MPSAFYLQSINIDHVIEDYDVELVATRPEAHAWLLAIKDDENNRYLMLSQEVIFGKPQISNIGRLERKCENQPAQWEIV